GARVFSGGGLFEELIQPGAPLADVATRVPEAPDRRRERQAEAVLATLLCPCQCDAQVIVLALQALDPLSLPLTRQVWLGRLGHLQEILSMRAPRARGIAARLQVLKSALANRLEHGKAQFALVAILPQQALVDERPQAIQDIKVQAAHGFGRFQR